VISLYLLLESTNKVNKAKEIKIINPGVLFDLPRFELNDGKSWLSNLCLLLP